MNMMAKGSGVDTEVKALQLRGKEEKISLYFHCV